MTAFKQALFAAAAVVSMAVVPIVPAMAGGHGHWGVGRGLVGAAVALATLPLTIASAVVAGGEAVARYPYTYPYENRAYGYAPPPAYPAPPTYYVPRPAYYPAPRIYYAPRPVYVQRAEYYGAYGARGYYGARNYYRPGGYPYPRR
jgi:hypothetical protein